MEKLNKLQLQHEMKTAGVQHFKYTGPIRRSGPRIGPNDPCPCGSKKKFKYCCARGRTRR